MIASTITITTIHLLGGAPLHPAPIGMAAFCSLLPDIDKPQSHMGRLCPSLSRFLYRRVGHRTLTHSIFGWAIAAIVFLGVLVAKGRKPTLSL
jgi:inner membrane protein